MSEPSTAVAASLVRCAKLTATLHDLLRHADTNSDLIDEVIKYQADRGNFAQEPEHLRRPNNDDQAPPPDKRPRSSRNRAPKQ